MTSLISLINSFVTSGFKKNFFFAFSFPALQSHTAVVSTVGMAISISVWFLVFHSDFFFPVYVTKVSKICNYEKNPYLYKIQCSLTELVWTSSVQRDKGKETEEVRLICLLLIQLAQFAFPV